jgi:hypothetical protein
MTMRAREVADMSAGAKPEAKPSGDGEVRRVVVSPLEVSAAQLQVAVDKRLGRSTPEWVVKLSRAERRSA